MFTRGGEPAVGMTAFLTRAKYKVMSALFILGISASTLGAFGVGVPQVHADGATYVANGVLGQYDYYARYENNEGPNDTGFAEPYAVALDATHHRLFVVEEENARVVVYNLNSSNVLVDKTADFVLGQPTFSTSNCNDPAAESLCEPVDLAYDGTNDRLFVADPEYSRVTVYDTATITNGEAAVHVLGQANLNSGSSGSATASTMNTPSGLAYDSARQYLYASDSNLGRVLVFDVNAITDGEAAVNELGYAAGGSAFTTADQTCRFEGALTAGTFCTPQRLAYDDTGKRLFVSDNSNYRVTIFDLTAITNGESAVRVLGQDTLTANAAQGSPAIDNILDAQGLAYDHTNERLFVGDAGSSGGNRVLVFNVNSGTMTNGEDASNVLGQANFTSSCADRCDDVALNTLDGPYGVAYDSGNDRLYVTDSFNNRALIFDTASITNGEAAVDYFGQSTAADWHENGLTTPNAKGFSLPDTTIVDPEQHHLYVADASNNRILMFNLNEDNTIGDKTADYLLGQETMNSDDGCGDPGTNLCFPTGIVIDTIYHHLYVADWGHNRVLMYNLDDTNVPVDATPDGVLGQPDLATQDCNGDGESAMTLCDPANLALDPILHRLYVADSGNDRILLFNLANDNTPLDVEADFVIGDDDFEGTTCTNAGDCLSSPYGIAIDTISHRLYIGDSYDNRVLIYEMTNQNVPVDGSAEAVLGQDDLEGNSCNQGSSADEDTLCYPSGIVVDSAGNRIFVADTGNNRVLEFALGDDDYPEDNIADGIIGQDDYTSDQCNQGNYWLPSEHTLCGPTGAFNDPQMSYDPATGLLYVPDTFNARVLTYNVGASGILRDNDTDGITNETEDDAPNNGDANNDGTPDSDQANVTSFVGPITNTYAVLESTCTANTTASIASEASQSTADGAFSYPAGLMHFVLACQTNGMTATVTQYYYGSYNASTTVARKYNSDTHVYSTIGGASLQSITIGGQAALKITYDITDGGSLDQDGSANSTIVDPTGPAVNSAGTPNTGAGGSALVKL
jgi:DNA-binding beta-propeller fold protein YncE